MFSDDDEPVAKLDELPENFDALFDLEEDPEFPDLQPALNVEELRKQAEQKYAAQQPARKAAHVLDDDGVDGAKDQPNGNSWKKGAKAKEDKPKRVIPKIDEERLLGPKGFPALIELSKTFKAQGKGHEASDLSRLMQMYQLWAHKMFPKTQFRDTVERTEKVCRSRRMAVALSTFRDVAKGQPPPIDVDGQEGDSSNESGNDMPTTTQPREPQPSTSSPPRSPATDRSMNTHAYSSDTDAQDEIASLSARRNPVVEDDDSFWTGMDMDMDADIDDGGKTIQAPPKSKANDAPMDWDLVRQMEEELASAEASSSSDPAAAGGSAAVSAPAVPNGNATHDDGWDDMYVDD